MIPAGLPRVLLLTVLLGLGPCPGLAQPPDELGALKKDIETLKEGQAVLQRELQEIKGLLRARSAAGEPPHVARTVNLVLAVDGRPTKGDPHAKVTLIEFSDYQCPFCGRYFRDTWPRIRQEYVETGKVRYVFRNFPLEAIHPLAFKAAEAAGCAGEQGKYWEMHDHLFVHQADLAPERLAGYAAAIGLDGPRFSQCLDGGAAAGPIRQDLADGGTAGVRGTPTFFLGVPEGDGATIRALRMIPGAVPYPAFKDALDGLLESPPG
jgi:protein-disulfide isomerase